MIPFAITPIVCIHEALLSYGTSPPKTGAPQFLRCLWGWPSPLPPFIRKSNLVAKIWTRGWGGPSLVLAAAERVIPEEVGQQRIVCGWYSTDKHYIFSYRIYWGTFGFCFYCGPCRLSAFATADGRHGGFFGYRHTKDTSDTKWGWSQITNLSIVWRWTEVELDSKSIFPAK